MQHGEHPVVYLSVVNLSDKPYEPVLMHLPPYLEMKAEPEVLQQGERGTLTLTLNSEKLTDLGLTQSSWAIKSVRRMNCPFLLSFYLIFLG